MKRILGVLVCASTVLLLGIGLSAPAQQTPFVIPEGVPALQAPILITTCGQSPGALMVGLICEELGIAYLTDNMITADQLAALAGGPTVYHTLFVTTGTSLKGMGAAGVKIESEVQRCVALIEKAKELGMFVIVGQVEGPSRRTDATDEESIGSMSPLANLLITRADVNGDGYFTRLAAEKNIPQIFINEVLDLSALLPLLLGS